MYQMKKASFQRWRNSAFMGAAAYMFRSWLDLILVVSVVSGFRDSDAQMDLLCGGSWEGDLVEKERKLNDCTGTADLRQGGLVELL
jgi:hypothetical protein